MDARMFRTHLEFFPPWSMFLTKNWKMDFILNNSLEWTFVLLLNICTTEVLVRVRLIDSKFEVAIQVSRHGALRYFCAAIVVIGTYTAVSQFTNLL